MSEKIQEDAPTNAMGASSSTSGPIQMFDPKLVMKNKNNKLLPFSIFRRVKGKQNVGRELKS